MKEMKKRAEFVRLKSSCEHTCLPMTHRSGVRRGEEGRGGFSAQLVYMIHLTELSSLHCTATNTLPTPLSVSLSVFKVEAVADNSLSSNMHVTMAAAPHVVSHQGSSPGYYSS